MRFFQQARNLFIAILFVGASALAQAPALPPGLGGGEAQEEAGPALPPGLGGSEDQKAEGPALPPGLGGASESHAPLAEQAAKAARPFPVHGFFDLRSGLRLQRDAAQSKRAPLGEGRLQLESAWYGEQISFDLTADFLGDAVLEEADFDLRRARLTWMISDTLDMRLGRQVLTWGTGDMLFINDLFPKDWPSFFIGRDVEYLKAPSDALKVGWYPKAFNLELVYTPQFDPDRHITGERISFYNPLFDTFQGDHDPLSYNAPSEYFSEDEIALRLYRRIGKFEAALYGYSGYWKSPGGQRLWPFMQACFPRLNVYGGSLRGPVASGIWNLEVGYYDSRDDEDGGDPMLNNSEFRLLTGYEREIGRDFTAALQYYWEHMMDYGAYMESRIPLVEARDQDRHLFTLRLTKLLLEQNLTLSLFTYYSPTDGDVYLRPNLHYKVNDQWSVELGGNLFTGETDYSFFGQFKYNSNLYAGLRYSF